LSKVFATAEKADKARFMNIAEGPVEASSYPPAITPIQSEFFPKRVCPLEARPATDWIGFAWSHITERCGVP